MFCCFCFFLPLVYQRNTKCFVLPNSNFDERVEFHTKVKKKKTQKFKLLRNTSTLIDSNVQLFFLLFCYFRETRQQYLPQHDFIIKWWGSTATMKWNRTFRWQSLCRKVLISIILYWLHLQFHKCELSDCFIIHHSVKVLSWQFITRRMQSHAQIIWNWIKSNVNIKDYGEKKIGKKIWEIWKEKSNVKQFIFISKWL